MVKLKKTALILAAFILLSGITIAVSAPPMPDKESDSSTNEEAVEGPPMPEESQETSANNSGNDTVSENESQQKKNSEKDRDAGFFASIGKFISSLI